MFSKNKLAVTICVLSVGFLALIGYSSQRGNVSAIENSIKVPINSIQGVFYSVGFKTREYGEFIFSFSKVKKENEELKKENDKLKNELIDYQSIKDERDRLYKEENFKNNNNDFNFLGCHIIGRIGGSVINGFEIDRGSKDGLKKGMIAVNDSGLVGQVTAVSNNSAVVQTLSNENIQVAAMVKDTLDSDGIVKGYRDEQGNSMAKIYHLQLNSTIKEDNLILTSGLGNCYPRGIKIGTVTSVTVDNINLETTAIISPAVDFNKLQEFMVIIPKNPDDVSYSGEIK